MGWVVKQEGYGRQHYLQIEQSSHELSELPSPNEGLVNIVILAYSLNERMILIGIGENVIVWW